MDTRAPRQRDARPSDDPASGGPRAPKVEEINRVELTVEIETTPEKVFRVLTDPNNITRYAGGIEGAEIIHQPNDGFLGATLELVTKNGNIRRAEVLRADHDCIEVLTERGLHASWYIEPLAGGKVRIRNVIEGPISTQTANQLRYDTDVKFQALQHIMDPDDPKAGSG